MPTRDKSRKCWRGQVRWQGKMYRRDFAKRKNAVEWEAKKREELQGEEKARTQTDMALVRFCNDYLDHARLRFTEKTLKEKRRICYRFLEHVGNLPVREVTPLQVHQYLQIQAETRSANASNVDRKNLMALWSWGQKVYGLPVNPVAALEKLPHDRVVQYTPPTEDVLKLLAAATREERVLLQAYLQTGARRGEVFRWRWHEDVNFDQRQVRLATRKTGDGSTEYSWLPMSDILYEELWWWWRNRRLKESPYVFPSTGRGYRNRYGEPHKERRWFLKTLCKRAGVQYFGYHALRRYVASVLADTHKVSSKTIQRILRHKKLSTTEKYIHKINQDLKATLDLMGEKSTQESTQSTVKKGDNDL
jgi:integrase